MRVDFFATAEGKNPMREIAENLIYHDPVFVPAHFRTYYETRDRINSDDHFKHSPSEKIVQ
jgi:hypothetical protein